jgi:hypothetical protein
VRSGVGLEREMSFFLFLFFLRFVAYISVRYLIAELSFFCRRAFVEYLKNVIPGSRFSWLFNIGEGTENDGTLAGMRHASMGVTQADKAG